MTYLTGTPADPDEPVAYSYGMWSVAGAAALDDVLGRVRAVLRAGLGRDTALLVLTGGCIRLEIEHPEYSDTSVRGSIRAALAGDCAQAGAAAFTDQELAQVSEQLGAHAVAGYTDGYTLRLQQEQQLPS